MFLCRIGENVQNYHQIVLRNNSSDEIPCALWKKGPCTIYVPSLPKKSVSRLTAKFDIDMTLTVLTGP